MIDNIMINGLYEDTKRKAEERVEWRMLNLQWKTCPRTEHYDLLKQQYNFLLRWHCKIQDIGYKSDYMTFFLALALKDSEQTQHLDNLFWKWQSRIHDTQNSAWAFSENGILNSG